MKKINFLYLALALLFVSCAKVDRKDIFSVAETVEKSFKQGKIDKLKPFFEYNMDSLSQEQKDKIKEIQTFYKENAIKKIEVDTSGSWFWKYCDISYLADDTYYEVSFSYDRDSVGNITLDGFYFTNINEACTKAENEPYCPKRDIDFKRISWTTDYYGTSFKSGAIELQNKTDFDINYIKFRVILAKGSNNYFLGETFFNQTVESYKPIYKGDIATIEVPGMSDYYAGFKIEKDNMQFDAELIEIKPKPISNWCLKVQKLDKKVKTMLNK
jgi:hypothetical protein